MKFFATLLLCSFLFLVKGYTQCEDGQDATTAALICGTKTTPHGTVPNCNGKNIPVFGCNDPFGTYQDINAYYYKFVCYTSGPFEFLIKPISQSDDYDWQIFDITNRNPIDVYDQNLAANIFVACNWSGVGGNTGTTTTATLQNGCQGTGVPTITKAPTILQGHTYLLMVSHFTPTGQSGYDFQPTVATSALITNTSSAPKIDTVTATCNAGKIIIKLNKQIACTSIDISDFDISANPVIAAVNGFGCDNSNSYTDSITITLATLLPAGFYAVKIIKGNDLNTLVDECGNEMVAGANPKTIKVYEKPSANFSATVVRETCKADTLKYSHDGNNNTNKWQWTFDGLPTTSNLQNEQVVYNSFNTRVVSLTVLNPSCSASITKNIPIANHLLIPNFTASRDTTCPNNPEKFTDISLGNITSWKWDFANGQTSTLSQPPNQQYAVLPINKNYPTKLIVSNLIGCIDSVVKNIFVRGTIPTVFDSIIPPTCAAKQVQIYFKQAMFCSSVSQDGSEFSIAGAAPNSILSASINCNIDNVGTVVTLQLANELVTGNYTVTLKKGIDNNTIINDCGIETLVTAVTFKAFGHIIIDTTTKYPVKMGCKVDTVNFFHTSNNGANSWQWSFLSGNPNMATSKLQNPSVIFTDFTARDFKLIVSNGYCTDSISRSLTSTIVNRKLQAKFGSVDTTCGNGFTIFTDSSTGNITNWFWNFGDKQTSNLQNPIAINYPLAYSFIAYPVQLIIKNSAGCLDTTKPIKNIVVRPAAPATIEKIDLLPCSPDSLVVYFNAPMQCSSVQIDGSDFSITGSSIVTISSAKIVNCNKNAGKVVVIKLASPIAVGGNYQLNLIKGNDGNTILNDCGIETPISTAILIVNTKVNANFSVDTFIGCKESKLLLQHTINNQENSWTWIVNGVVSGNTNEYALAFKESKNISVTLITKNPICSSQVTKNIALIFDKIKASFIVSNNNIVCPTDAVIFTNTSTGNISFSNWNFGDTGRSRLQNPPARFYNPPAMQTYSANNIPVLTGDNSYKLTATLVSGNNVPCYDTAYQEITITSNCLIKVPSAFTPNNDGLNDFLYPLNAYKASDFVFSVYNRLGRLVYVSKDRQAKWEGNYQRVKQPAGTYVWTLVYTDKDSGKKVNLNGTTVLIR